MNILFINQRSQFKGHSILLQITRLMKEETNILLSEFENICEHRFRIANAFEFKTLVVSIRKKA